MIISWCWNGYLIFHYTHTLIMFQLTPSLKHSMFSCSNRTAYFCILAFNFGKVWHLKFPGVLSVFINQKKKKMQMNLVNAEENWHWVTTESLSALSQGPAVTPAPFPFFQGGWESKPWKDRTVEARLQRAEGSIHSQLLYAISPKDMGPLQSVTHPRQADRGILRK